MWYYKYIGESQYIYELKSDVKEVVMEKSINISGVQNAEKAIEAIFNEQKGREFRKVTVDGNVVTFSFGEFRKDAKKVMVKQFSKKKYETIEQGLTKFFEDELRKGQDAWKETDTIERKKYWIVVFVRK